MPPAAAHRPSPLHAIRARRRSVVAALVALAASAGALASATRPAPKASFDVRSDRTAYDPGALARIAAVMEIDEGWHVNSHQPSHEYLIPTALELELPAGWRIEGIDYPPGEMQRFAFEDKPLSVYHGSVVIVGSVRIGGEELEGTFPVVGRLTFQACNDRSCLPPETLSRRLELLLAEDGVAIDDPAFTTPTADAAATATPPGTGLPFSVMLLLAALGGLILNAMPCVLPVLSLKLFGLVKSAGEGRRPVVFGALATGAGILLSFWLLSAAAVAARSAGLAVGWGVQFQEPVFVALLTVIVLLFCLNLWGLFEIPLPAGLAAWADSGPRRGLPGHLLSGLFATLMATPCSAPFLGTALGFALGQPAGTVFAAFTAIGLGMALPYLALATFPGALKLVPRPGPWMDRLRGFMGFLLAAAAVWLFYVLAAQLSRERLAFLQLAVLAMALFVWWGHAAARGGLWRKVAAAGAIAAAAGILLLAAGGATRPAAATERAGGLIDWLTWDRAEAEGLAAEGRLVFVDVTADWCFTCKVNERLALETTEVAEAFGRHEVVAMKADWTNRDDAITAFLADHGRYGIPFYLLYRPGREPYLFSELITKETVVAAVEEAADPLRMAG
jgi:suppressor for copper-sensitivity B